MTQSGKGEAGAGRAGEPALIRLRGVSRVYGKGDATVYALRDVDLLGRYGGEEFLVVLPGAEARGAVACAERVRVALELFSPEVEAVA